jgi:hypothetical protein
MRTVVHQLIHANITVALELAFKLNVEGLGVVLGGVK